MKVKMGMLPGKIKEVVLPEGQEKLSEALLVGGIKSTTGYEVRVNGKVVKDGFVLKEGDNVVLAKKIKGN